METSLAAVLTFMRDRLTLNEIVRLTSLNPARIMKISGGEIRVGAPADFAIVDLNEKWIVKPENLHGRSRNAVFKGEELTGKVKATFCGGKRIF